MTKPTQCLIADCTKPVLARGWCNTHYQRWLKFKDPEYPVQAQVHGGSVLDRYWAKVDQSAGPAGCWPWIGGRQRYGIFWGGDRRPSGAPIMVKAHRWTYEQFVGPIPDGLVVCHTCDNPPCVNPAHLFVGTQGENVQDMVSKGRGGPRPTCPPEARRRGMTNPAAKLTEAAVREIRGLYKGRGAGPSQQALADQFGVTQTIISAIVLRKVWQHID